MTDTNSNYSIKKMILLNLITGGSALIGIIINASLMKYYTDIIGLDPYIYGIVFVIFSIWNGANDILIAYWADKIPFHPVKGKYGRFIGWAIPVIGVSLFAVMNVSPGWHEMMIAAYLLILLIVYECAKALLDISFGAFIVNTFITSEYRAKNATVANYINMLPVFAGGMIPVWFLTGDYSRMTVIAIFTGCILFGIGLMFIGSRFIREDPEFYARIKVAGSVKEIIKLLKDLVTDKMIVLYIVAFSMIKIATGNYMAGYIYYMDNVLEVGSMQATIPDVIIGVIQMSTFPLIVLAVKRYGVKRTYISGMMFAVVGHALLTMPFGYLGVVAMYCMVLLGYGFASVLVPVWGGLMVDHIDLKTGKRQPAMIGGLLSIVFVPAASIQPLIMSTMLSATGYVGGQKHQTAEVAQAIRVATGIIPAVILLAGLGLLMLMPISFAREKEIQQLINEKHTGEAEAVA